MEMRTLRLLLIVSVAQDFSSAQPAIYIDLAHYVHEMNRTLNDFVVNTNRNFEELHRKIEAQGDIQMKLEKLEDTTSRNKESLKNLDQVTNQLVKKNDLGEFMRISKLDMQQKLEHLESNIQGAAVNNQESFQELHFELEQLKGLSQETGQCLQRDDLEHLTNVSAAVHQEIKSFVREEISGVISLAQKDECSERSLPCGSRGICHDSLFSFTCSCPSGFTWDGSECADIDECIQGNVDCNQNLATCTNTAGGYSCSCNPPFEGDGRTCFCPLGFASNGDICEDIDECAEGKDICSPNATCKNSIGSYSCSCNKPFEGDVKTNCEIQCRLPAKVIKGLGCIKQSPDARTFWEIRAFCREEGGRLLQHFNQHDLNDVMNTFGFLVGKWVGIYDGKWTSDESLVPEDLWEEGSRSDPSRRCGIVFWELSSSSYKESERDCSQKRRGLCQIQLP